jgi:multisubunit Na+/H+ antiporter MnhB subunit
MSSGWYVAAAVVATSLYLVCIAVIFIHHTGRPGDIAFVGIVACMIVMGLSFRALIRNARRKRTPK